MKKKKIINWLSLFGMISVIFYFLHDIIGAKNYPGYNWMSQAVTDLTATDSPSFVIAHSLSSIYGLLSCISLTALSIIVRKENKILRIGIYLFTMMNYISAIGYFLFPLSSAGYDKSIQSFIHVYIITILVVLLSIISLIMIAIGSLKGKKKHKGIGITSIIALVLMFIGAVGSQNVPKEIFGLIERFSTYSAVLFTGILGTYGFLTERNNRFERSKENE